MRIILTVLVAVALISFSQQAMAQTATIIAGTGEVVVTGMGAGIGIDFKSADNNLIAANGTNFGIYDISLAPGILSWFDFGGFSDPFSLGNILPTGLTGATGITFEFVAENFATLPGTVVFDGGEVIPEPGTLLLASMGLLGYVATRRRRS